MEALGPVLNSSETYIRSFAAEAFGFLLRKIKQDKLVGVFSFMVTAIDTFSNDNFSEGVSLLVVESIKVGYFLAHAVACKRKYAFKSVLGLERVYGCGLDRTRITKRYVKRLLIIRISLLGASKCDGTRSRRAESGCLE